MIIDGFKKNISLKTFLKLKESNIEEIKFHFSKEINSLKQLYEISLRYSVPFFGDDDLLSVYKPKLKNQIIVFQNNNSIISLIDGILSLLDEGNFLAVNTLQRSLFEFLIINNHLILTKDFKFIESWIKNKDVKIVKNILKRTNNKKNKDLIEFWVVLSKYSHASLKTSQSEFDMTYNYGEYTNNIFTTYILLYFYNYQLRGLYFPFMKATYLKFGTKVCLPFKSDWFKKKDSFKEFEKNKNEKLSHLLDAFIFKWKLIKN